MNRNETYNGNAHYEYLKSLLVLSLIKVGTVNMSLEDLLIDESINNGRSRREAESEVQCVMNLKSAVLILLSKSLENALLN